MAALARKRETAFDNLPKHLTNLSMGAPSEPLLGRCREVMKAAVAHRMVRKTSGHS